MTKRSDFYFGSSHLKVSFLRTEEVKDGVVCDIYTFREFSDADLAIVQVDAGCCTPLQRVVGGDRTIEIHLEGGGRFELVSPSGLVEVTPVAGYRSGFEVDVPPNWLMRWRAVTCLTFAEVCFPPYEPGRFVDVET